MSLVANVRSTMLGEVGNPRPLILEVDALFFQCGFSLKDSLWLDLRLAGVFVERNIEPGIYRYVSLDADVSESLL
jgi:hypothetical protein